MILGGEGGGDRRHDAGGEGDHEGGWQVIDGHGFLIGAVEAHGHLLAVAQGALEEVLNLDGVDIGGDGHHGGAEGDGDRDDQQGLQNAAGGVGPVVAEGMGGSVPPVVAEDQVDQGDEAAGGHAADGSGGGDLTAEAQPEQVPGQNQAYHQLGHRLDDLGDRCGDHVRVALGEAPVGRDGAQEEGGQGHDPDGGGSHAVSLEVGQGLGPEEHDGRGDRAQNDEGQQAHPEDPVHLVVTAQGVGLGDGLGHGHGQACGGDHQQQVEDRVGVVEVAEAHVPQDAAQGDLVQGADELDHDDAHGQGGGPAEEGTFLG